MFGSTTTGKMNLWGDEAVGCWVSEARGCTAVAWCADGLSEAGDRRTSSWDAADDEEHIRHVSLPTTSTWTTVLMSDRTVNMRASNRWIVVSARTAGELGGRRGGCGIYSSLKHWVELEMHCKKIYLRISWEPYLAFLLFFFCSFPHPSKWQISFSTAFPYFTLFCISVLLFQVVV